MRHGVRLPVISFVAVLILTLHLSVVAQPSQLDYAKMADGIVSLIILDEQRENEHGQRHLWFDPYNACTGFFLDRLHVVTCAHCVANAKTIYVKTWTNQSKDFYFAVDGVVAQPEWNDLVLLRLKNLDGTGEFASHESHRLSDIAVFRWQTAVLIKSSGDKPNLTPVNGSFRFPMYDLNHWNNFIIDIGIERGYSGSPIFNSLGQVAAVFSRWYAQLPLPTNKLGLAIDNSTRFSLVVPIKNFIEELNHGLNKDDVIPLAQWSRNWAKTPYYKYLMGVELCDQGNYDKAREYFLSALGVSEEFPVANPSRQELRLWDALGYVDFASDRNQQAVIAYRNVYSMTMDDHAALLYLAYSLEKLKTESSRRESMDVIRKLTSLKPRNPLEISILEDAQAFYAKPRTLPFGSR